MEGTGSATQAGLERYPQMAAKLQLKRIYEPAAPGDGARILVDRVWPRGVTKEAAALTLWFRDIAPTPALRKWFGHDPARWAEFRRRYREELAGNAVAVAHLRAFLKEGPVTLLYGARDPDHNHALVLEEFMRRRASAPRAAGTGKREPATGKPAAASHKPAATSSKPAAASHKPVTHKMRGSPTLH